MTEIHFIVEEAPEGGYIARGVGVDIITEADDYPSLHRPHRYTSRRFPIRSTRTTMRRSWMSQMIRQSPTRYFQ